MWRFMSTTVLNNKLGWSPAWKMCKPQEVTTTSSKHVQLSHAIIKFPTYTFTSKNYIHKTHSKLQDTQHSQFNSHNSTGRCRSQGHNYYICQNVRAATTTKTYTVEFLIIEINNYSRVYHKPEHGREEES